jgi:glycosyltransferase involved in cell wall biosynthesis
MSELPSADDQTLYLDITSAWQERGRIAHGTTRVERGIITGLAGLRLPEVQFCHYERGRQRFVAVPAAQALAVAAAKTLPERRRNPVQARRRHPLARTGKRVEAWVRHNIRDRLRRRRIESAVGNDEPPLFAPNSTLLIPGELQRQDFAVLMRLKRQLALRLAFVFYDLLGVLPPDDPRLQNPAAYDLPSSDFMVREADLVLAISEHSRRILLDHIAARGGAGPRVEVIRLGHLVRTGTPGGDAPVGLRAGEFVLTVGDVVARKNHALLIKVWRQLLRRCPAAVKPLVIVGRVTEEGVWLTDQIAADAVLGQYVRVLSNADDGQLEWLYANCLFTVFPSLVEGYGLPVGESLAAGKVCVASSTSSMPEVSQGCGIHLDPRDLGAWVAELERLLTDPAEFKRQTERALRFRPLTWSDTATDIRRLVA